MSPRRRRHHRSRSTRRRRSASSRASRPLTRLPTRQSSREHHPRAPTWWSWRTPTRARPSSSSTRPTRKTRHDHSSPVPEVHVSVFLVCTLPCHCARTACLPKPALTKVLATRVLSTARRWRAGRVGPYRRRDAWYTSNTFTRRRPSATTPPAPPASTSQRCSGRSPGTAARSASRASRRPSS